MTEFATELETATRVVAVNTTTTASTNVKLQVKVDSEWVKDCFENSIFFSIETKTSRDNWILWAYCSGSGFYIFKYTFDRNGYYSVNHASGFQVVSCHFSVCRLQISPCCRTMKRFFTSSISSRLCFIAFSSTLCSTCS